MIDFLICYIWHILIICGVVSAFFNSTVCILVLFRKKFTFSCKYMITEYVMLLCIIFAMLKRIVSDKLILTMFAAFILMWFLLQLYFKIKKLMFIRVYGIHRKMHTRLSEYLNDYAKYNGMDRTNMYIYGGDTKTPCNMIIFKKVPKKTAKHVLSEINVFLKQYSVLSVANEILLLCLNIAVVFIMLNGVM